MSLTKDETLELIEYIKMVNVLKGNNVKQPVQIEIENGHVESFRRAIYPAMDIKEGDVITEASLVCLRPSNGLSSRYYYDLIGKRAKKNLKKNCMIDLDCFK